MHLNDSQIRDFREQGVIFPVAGLNQEQVRAYRSRVESLMEENSMRIPKDINAFPHVLFPWLNQLIRHPAILDAVEDILGPNLLCWNSGFFVKPAGDPAFVSWHQDATYWGLSHPDVVTAWVALTPSNRANGCLRVVPGSHLTPVQPHRETRDRNNLLSLGQEIQVDVNERDVVDVLLRPGQFSIHHVMLIHGSEPNRSEGPRIGCAIRYLPTYVRRVQGTFDSASLVRGVDEYHHFVPEPVPKVDYDPECRRFHAEALARGK